MKMVFMTCLVLSMSSRSSVRVLLFQESLNFCMINTDCSFFTYWEINLLSSRNSWVWQDLFASVALLKVLQRKKATPPPPKKNQVSTFLTVLFNKVSQMQRWENGWRDGSSRAPKFGSQHSYQSAHKYLQLKLKGIWFPCTIYMRNSIKIFPFPY